QQQFERNSSCSLRVTLFSIFLERAAGTIAENRNRQQFYRVQFEKSSCSNLTTETDQQNIRCSRGLGSSNSCNPHPWNGEYDSRFSFQTCDIGQLFPQRRDLVRSTCNVEDKTIDRHVLQLPQLKVQEVCWPVAGQKGSSLGLSLNIMATRRTVSTPSYPSDTVKSKQTNGRERIGIDDPPILAISTVLAGFNEDDIKIDNPGRSHRRFS
ncbi:MAG: hypothetical protein EZS28_055143, partial [Streblomastix strix]